jgi:hypothetical protein
LYFNLVIGYFLPIWARSSANVNEIFAWLISALPIELTFGINVRRFPPHTKPAERTLLRRFI